MTELQNLTNITQTPSNCSLIESIAAGENWPYGKVDFIVQHCVFPIQFVLGVVGNLVNLFVLLSDGMKSQANTLLSAMAIADIGFLLCMLPHSMSSYSPLQSSRIFSYLYFRSKHHLIAIANFFSTAANFLVLAVSIERLSGVRRPMNSLRDSCLFSYILGGIYIVAFLMNFYQHFEYTVTIVEKCDTFVSSLQHIDQRQDAFPFTKYYIHISKLLQLVIGIAIPVIAVFVLNISLLYYLRKSKFSERRNSNECRNGNETADSNHLQEICFNRNSEETFQKRERKVTITVIAIISCFTLTHLPTLLPSIWEYIFGQNRTNRMYHNVVTILNSLVVTGKVLNFFLFCSSSKHFRRRTRRIFEKYMCNRCMRKKYSSMTTSAHMASTIATTLNGAGFGSGFGTDRSDRLAQNLQMSQLQSARNASPCPSSSAISTSGRSRAPSHSSSLQHRSGTTTSSEGAFGYRMRQTTPRERTTSVAGSASLDNGATRSLLTVHQRGSDLTEEDKDTVMEFLNVPINNN